MSRALKFVFLFLVLATVCSAQDLASFEKRVTIKKLSNGLTAIVCQRPDSAPVFSFYTNVDAGSVQDPMGKTGLAHMFEHMAFKGTDTIGTKNYPAEKAALQKVEEAYAAYLHERDKPVGRDEQKLKQLEKSWQDATKAEQYVVPNEFSEIVERNGGENLNASTSDDHTEYHYAFAVNRLELWAYLESERFIHPVFREFYKERNVVIEERRMRTDSSPIGRLIEQFLFEAFAAHPYHRPTIGYISDLNSFSATDAQHFFDTYYIPSNMVVAVAGDIRRLTRSIFLIPTTFLPTWSWRWRVISIRRRPWLLSRNISAGFHRMRSRTSGPLPSLRRILSGGWCCMRLLSRFMSRVITARTIATKMMLFMTRWRTYYPRVGLRGCIAPWSAIRRSLRWHRVVRDFPE